MLRAARRPEEAHRRSKALPHRAAAGPAVTAGSPPQSPPSCSSNMRRRHSSHDQQPPAADASVRAVRPSARRAAVGAQRRALTDDGAEGISTTNAQAICFQQIHAQQPPRLRRTPSERPFFLLVADSIHVHAQQPVNASVFAAPGCRPLIPLWFPHSNFRLLCSSHSGVTCHPPAGAEHRVLSPGVERGRRSVHQSCGSSTPAVNRGGNNLSQRRVAGPSKGQ